MYYQRTFIKANIEKNLARWHIGAADVCTKLGMFDMAVKHMVKARINLDASDVRIDQLGNTSYCV